MSPTDPDQANGGIRRDIDEKMSWQIWVSNPFNQEAEVLLKWSRTSFFGGCPTSDPKVIDGVEYILFQKCGAEWTLKYALSTAIANYRYVKLFEGGQEVSLEPYLKDIPRPSGKLLGDAATMERTGGMC